MDRTLTLVGSKSDPHLVLIEEQLIEMGVKPHYLDTSNLDRVSLFLCRETNNPILSIGDRIIDLTDPQHCFYFWVKPLAPNFGSGEDWQAAYINNEMLKGFTHNLRYLTQARSINPYQETLTAEMKFRQIQAAHKIGLRVPSSLVSNDRRRLLDWTKETVAIITKSLPQSIVMPTIEGNDGNLFLTSKVTPEALQDENLTLDVPGFFQERISSKNEVRVFVVGRHIRGFSMQLPESADLMSDKRFFIATSEFEPIDVPPSYKEKILYYMDRLSLFHAQFDFIVDQHGEWVFLEANPQGTWAWLENEGRDSLAALMATEMLAQLRAM